MRQIVERYYLVDNTTRKIGFEDVIGYEKEKEELREIQDFIINVKKYEEIGARIPKGVLLLGESGNGKTLMAKALSSSISIPFYSVGDELNEDTSVKSIREVFSQARKNAPCIIFIDEIDKIDGDNFINHGPFSKTMSPVIRELLTQMDGFQVNSGIMVIATANSTFGINESLLRSGRFDRIIGIRMPNRGERKQLLEYYSKNKQLDETVDFEKLAIQTSGLSCADIDNVLNDSALMSIRDNRNTISMKDIETAIDRVMFGATVQKISDDVRRKTAIHEIGHAVVAISIGQLESLNKISIISRGQTLGFNRFSFDDDKVEFTTRNRMFNQMVIAYGGVAAELINYKDISTSCIRDLEESKRLVDMMVKRFGMLGITNCTDTTSIRYEDGSSQKKKRKVEKLVDGLLSKALKEAIRLVKKNKLLFNELYNKLIENNVIYKEEIEEVAKGLPL